jgi:ketosteroid isomerase-like protein
MIKKLVAALALLTTGCSPDAPEVATPAAERTDALTSVPINPPAAPDSPAGAVDAFAAALRTGDQAAVQQLLAPDVLIAEGGGAERSFAEYASHHMSADMAFTGAVQFTLERREIIDSGDTVTVISQSQAQGEFRGRPIHVRMMETMVLRRVEGGWQIAHIHWSSAPISEDH